MREIKFQGIDENNKIYNLIGINYSNNTGLCEVDGVIWFTWNSFKKFRQFTGLLDKNGKEIYEGDICIYKTGEKKGGVYSEETVFKGFVRDDEARFEIGNHNGYGGDWEDLSMLIGHYHKIEKEFEVIGNIFENPELLN